MPLGEECLPEAVVGPGDAHPRDEPGQARGVDQPLVGLPVPDEGGDEARRPDEGRHDEGGDGDPVRVRPLEEGRGAAAMRQGVEHAGRCVQPRVARGQDRCEDDGVHDRGGGRNPRLFENEGEGGDRHVGDILAEQTAVLVVDEGADHEDRADVEEQDPPEDRADGLGDLLLGIGRLPGGHADHLRALEAEARHHEDRQDTRESVDEGGLALRPVVESGVGVAEDAGDDEDAQDEEDDDHDDLDEGEPELPLPVGARGQGVERDEDREEDGRPHPPGDVGEPVLHDEGRRDELGGDRDRPVVPEVPPRGEAEAGADEARAVLAEGARDGYVGRHLAQRLHEQEDHDSDEPVGDEGAAGPAVVDCLAGGHEQAGADGSADGDHCQVPGAQAALERVVLGCLVLRGRPG